MRPFQLYLRPFFRLNRGFSEQVKLPVAQYRPRKSPNISFITDFFLRLDNNTSFDDVYPWGPDHPAPDEVVLKNRQAYYATVSYVDEQVGKLMDALTSLKLRSETIVVVHGDHGYQLAEHNEWEKKTNFELAARVPLLISVPWKPRSLGIKTGALVELVDTYPTLAALANLPPPPGLEGQGTNLAPLFDAPERGAAFKNFSYTNYPVCTAPGSPGRDYPEGSHSPAHAGTHGCVFGGSKTDRHYYKMGYSLRTDNWRYTAWVPWHGEQLVGNWSAAVALWPNDGVAMINRELYDHRTDTGSEFDRYENENLADDPQYKGIVHELHEILKQHHTEQCEQCCAKEKAECFAPVQPPPAPPHRRNCTSWAQEGGGVRFDARGSSAAITFDTNHSTASWPKAKSGGVGCDAVALIAGKSEAVPA